MSIAVMKQALEAYENIIGKRRTKIDIPDTFDALRTAIEEAERQEPVAWKHLPSGEYFDSIEACVSTSDLLPLYSNVFRLIAEVRDDLDCTPNHNCPVLGLVHLPAFECCNHCGAEPEPITHSQPAIPEGWQLVPMEPTEKMLDAIAISEIDWHGRLDCYKAMLAAAPKPEEVKP